MAAAMHARVAVYITNIFATPQRVPPSKLSTASHQVATVGDWSNTGEAMQLS